MFASDITAERQSAEDDDHEAEYDEYAAAAFIASKQGYRGEVGENGKCRRCAGTGQFITYVENGVPKGPGGICFRCGGKGVQTEDDQRRNWGYDMFGVRLY